jgi:hypothetical protein
MRVGPFYDSTENDMLTIDTVLGRSRKPSVELLESIKLRPTYVRLRARFHHPLNYITSCFCSFPSPRGGVTPTLPSFRLPQYGYNSMDNDDYSDSGDLYPTMSPQSYIDDGPIGRQATVLGGVISSTSFFGGVKIPRSSSRRFL